MIPNLFTYNSLTENYCKVVGLGLTFKLFDELVDREGNSPNMIYITSISDVLLEKDRCNRSLEKICYSVGTISASLT